MSKLLHGNKRKTYNSKSKRDLEWMDFDDDDVFENGRAGSLAQEASFDAEYDEEAYEDDAYEDDTYEDEDYDDGFDDDEDYDEDYDDEDDDDEEDDYDDDDIIGYIPAAGKKARKVRRRKSLSDYMLIVTGVLVVALLAVTGSLVMKERMEEKQVAAFAELGAGLEEIPVI
ncbi:MAG: hypothetical protein IKY23_03375, partial [Lachnospiraceae bacterium]|nr:hypothetical protein [Lachnospiraceae bacterium]